MSPSVLVSLLANAVLGVRFDNGKTLQHILHGKVAARVSEEHFACIVSEATFFRGIRHKRQKVNITLLVASSPSYLYNRV